MNYYVGTALCLVSWAGHAQTQLPAFPPAASPAQATPLGQNPSSPATYPDLLVTRTRLGVKVGGAMTTKVGDLRTAPATKLLAGGVVGVYQLVPLSQRRGRQRVQFYFQPELLFSMQGFRLENVPTRYEARIRSYYACLPLLVTASWKGLLVQAGVQGGYMLGVSERYDFSLPTPGVGYSYDTSVYQRKEIAYVVGAGYRLPQGLGLEVRYVAGLTDLYDKNGRSLYALYTDQHNAGVQVQLSYPLLKK
jgi:hypothetical protein